MPVTDGFEACRQILLVHKSKKRLSISEFLSPKKSTKPLIVAVSGYVDQIVEQKAKSAGFRMVFESPLSVDQI